MQNELTENTIEWWLNQITDPIIKRLALGNMDNETKRLFNVQYYYALCCSFDWRKSNEGVGFWASVANNPSITFESVKILLPENYVL